MKMMTAAVVGAGVIGLAACGAPPLVELQAPVAHSVAVTAAKPAVTKTVVKYQTVAAVPPAAPAAAPAQQPAAAPAAAPAQQPADQNVTDPWAVVSAYYGDIESGNYEQAYVLLGSGTTTRQSYQVFASGYSCTGAETLSENWESGDQVNFDLTAVDKCSGVTQYYSGTDTVQNGIIVVADVVQS